MRYAGETYLRSCQTSVWNFFVKIVKIAQLRDSLSLPGSQWPSDQTMNKTQPFKSDEQKVGQNELWGSQAVAKRKISQINFLSTLTDQSLYDANMGC